MIVVGICGGSASGKSTVARLVSTALESEGHTVEVLGLDKFFRRNDPDAPTFPFSYTNQPEFNANHPETVDVEKTLQTIKASNAKIVILEGHLILALKELDDICDFTAYLDLPDDIRAARRIARDIKDRRLDGDLDKIVAYYIECAHPGHLEWVEPYKQDADLMVDGMLPPELIADLLASVVLEQVG